ncbi:MAG: DUF1080 domain-containing protein [Planctomycetaceae bacterium]
MRPLSLLTANPVFPRISTAASLAVIASILFVGCANEESTGGSENAEFTIDAESAAPASMDEASDSFKFIEPPLTSDEIREGWISLFDGSTLFGWDVPNESNWHVEDSAIVADSGDKSLLMTPFRFSDFELRCDFHLAAGGNSGIFLRCADSVTDPSRDTYELNICDTHASHKTGSLVGRLAVADVPAVEGAWHTFRVHCEGARIQVWLDEKAIVDFVDESDAVRLGGTIGLQMNEGRIAFRNVFLKPVQSRDLFDGQSTSGWNVVPGSKSKFEIVDGSIHVTDGPGFLETTDAFDNFLLHVEARTNGDGLNSGVFFRAMKGTEEAPSHGYEMQIQNACIDGDRTKPADSGSGAIFRRVAARYVVADDHEWFTETLIAQGDRIATWVNGYQVVDWQDTRDDDDNPRKGRRLAAGHISLQGHDPTTDLNFRVIRISELP